MLTRKFGRKKAARSHMLRNLAASVILFEKVETTEAKAKEIRRMIDRSITVAKKNTLASRRELESLYFDKNVAKKLVEVLAPRYTDRPSGYTRLLKLGQRAGDGVDKALLLLIPDTKADAKAEAKAAKTTKTEAKAEEAESTKVAEKAEEPSETEETTNA